MVSDYIFTKAEKRQAKLRLALDGPSGSGKTWTALVTARALAGPGGKVAVIDSERGSASLYADRFDFDVLELHGSYDPARYIQAIRAAERADYQVIVVDSLSHAWEAEGGVQEIADRNKKGGNTWSGWAAATPAYRSLVDAILQSTSHVIATMRTKVEWAEEVENGKKKYVKVGTAPVMRQGIDYEFTVVGDLDVEHVMRISKSRCPAVADKSYRHPGPEFGETLLVWLEDGAEPLPPPVATISDGQRRKLFAMAKTPGGVGEAELRQMLSAHNDGNDSTKDLPVTVFDAIVAEIEARDAGAEIPALKDADGSEHPTVEGQASEGVEVTNPSLGPATAATSSDLIEEMTTMFDAEVEE